MKARPRKALALLLLTFFAPALARAEEPRYTISFEDCPDPLPVTLAPPLDPQSPPRGVIITEPLDNLTGLWEFTTIIADTTCPGDRLRVLVFTVPVLHSGATVSGSFTAPDSKELFKISGIVIGQSVQLTVINGLQTVTNGALLDPTRRFISGQFSGIDPDGGIEGEPCFESGTFTVHILDQSDPGTPAGLLARASDGIRGVSAFSEQSLLARLQEAAATAP